MHKKRLYPGLALLLVVCIFGTLFTVDLLKTGKSAQAVTPDDWTTYLYTLGHSGFNGAETAINPNTAGSLKQLWSISEGSTISTQPVVTNGLIYWGSWDGIEHAIRLDGSQVWTCLRGSCRSRRPSSSRRRSRRATTRTCTTTATWRSPTAPRTSSSTS